MKEYPEYIFMSSQPQLYKYVKKNAPQVYEQIKERVKEGRWETEGGMFVEADCNLASGEALVRQFMHGKKFFKDEFETDVASGRLWIFSGASSDHAEMRYSIFHDNKDQLE